MKTAIPPRSFHPQYKAELIMIFDRCKYISDLCKTLNRSIAWINKVYDSETVKLKMSDQIPPSLADKLMYSYLLNQAIDKSKTGRFNRNWVTIYNKY